MVEHNKNCLRVKMTNINEAVTVTNNRAQYFADLAKQYRDEAKEHRDNAKQYAEQNSDVTLDYVETMRATLNRKIDACVLKNNLPNISEFKNDANYVDIDELNTSVLACANNSLNKSQITNCILEKPKYLNWNYADGVITLKAGSKLIYPDGFNSDGSKKFSYYTTTKDFVWDQKSTTASLRYLWFARTGQYGNNFGQEMLYVGDTAPTLTGNYCLWYDTANNVLKNTSNKGANWQNNQGTFPFMTVQQQASEAGYAYPTSVFDGIGIMDKCAWVADGVKVLVPDGRNSDGTLKNIEATSKASVRIAPWSTTITKTSPLIINSEGVLGNSGTRYVESETEPTFEYVLWYNPLTNEMKYKDSATSTWGSRQYAVVGSCYGTYGTLWTDHFSYTEFNLKLPFRAVDYSNFRKEIDAKVSSPIIDLCTTKATIVSSATSITPVVVVQNYVNGTSWYRVWSDGWKEQGGIVTNVGSVTVTFLKSFTDTNYYINCNSPLEVTYSFQTFGIGSRTNTGFTVMQGNYNNDGGACDSSWYACGY